LFKSSWMQYEMQKPFSESVRIVLLAAVMLRNFLTYSFICAINTTAFHRATMPLTVLLLDTSG
jgi:hypothetical protein